MANIRNAALAGVAMLGIGALAGERQAHADLQGIVCDAIKITPAYWLLRGFGVA